MFSRLLSFLLLFDYQEAFHCCLVVACRNRINMISIDLTFNLFDLDNDEHRSTSVLEDADPDTNFFKET